MIRLASNSQTRADILDAHGILYVQSGTGYDEDSIKTLDPKSFVYEATKGKFNDAIHMYGYDDLPLLVADTVVTTNNLLLRKAKDVNDARAMLELQSNNEVSVITCMIYKSKKLEFIDLSTTTYVFDKFDEQELQNYLDSNEWMGKAGGIMVEGFCKKYIKNVIGYESCAMGLTIEKLLPFID